MEWRPTRPAGGEAGEQARALAEAKRLFCEEILNPPAILEAVTSYAELLIEAEAAVLLLHATGTGASHAAEARPTTALTTEVVRLLAAARNETDPSALGTALRQRRPFLVARVASDPSGDPMRAPDLPAIQPSRARTISSLLVVPVQARGRDLGTLAVARCAPDHPFTAADDALLQDFAGHAALALDNARLVAELHDAVRLRNECLATLAHDIRDPLTVLKGYSDLIRRSPGLEPPLLTDGLDRIDANVTAIDRVVEAMLDVGRLAVGDLLLITRRPTDIVGLAQRALLDRQLGAPEHHFRFASDVSSAVGEWDGERLERVLASLLSNAVSYSPAGSEVALLISREAEGDTRPVIVLRVRDTGIGIPAGAVPRVFELFYRAPNVPDGPGGSGIGLYLAAQVIEQHGGSIAVASEEGSGTEVVIRLPLGVSA